LPIDLRWILIWNPIRSRWGNPPSPGVHVEPQDRLNRLVGVRLGRVERSKKLDGGNVGEPALEELADR
jgi:hypothetical protein